ncbi:MAG: type II secretion system F family protein [Candidatus Aminicenantia bacterium]
MPYYQYKARDGRGKEVKGVIIAENESALALTLERLNLFLVNAKEVKKERESLRPVGIKRRDLITFTIHLSTSLEAGIALITAIRDFAESTENIKFKEVLMDIVKQLEAGAFLSDAMSKYPRVFSELYVNILRAGEATGNMDMVLKDLIKFLEWQEEINSQIKQASIYPSFVISLIIGVIIIMMTFTLPKFFPILKSFNVELPLPTKIVMGVSNFFIKSWYIILAILVAFIVTYILTNKTKEGRKFWDSIKLSLPIFGNLNKKVALSRFSHYLSILYRAGIGIVQALYIVEKIVGNAIIAEEIKNLRGGVIRGESLSEGMKKSANFPPLVTRMIEVGEDTGKLDESLNKVSEYYDREVPATIRRFFAILEPTMIVLLGGMVLFMALSIFLPMYRLTSTIGAGVR